VILCGYKFIINFEYFAIGVVFISSNSNFDISRTLPFAYFYFVLFLLKCVEMIFSLSKSTLTTARIGPKNLHFDRLIL